MAPNSTKLQKKVGTLFEIVRVPRQISLYLKINNLRVLLIYSCVSPRADPKPGRFQNIKSGTKKLLNHDKRPFRPIKHLASRSM